MCKSNKKKKIIFKKICKKYKSKFCLLLCGIGHFRLRNFDILGTYVIYGNPFKYAYQVCNPSFSRLHLLSEITP